MIRKNIYKWHRISSLIIAIPVLLWAVSGFMHPLMTTIKPKVATQVLTPASVDSNSLEYPLHQALQLNKISAIHNVRLVHIDTNWFYQVQLQKAEPPVYLSAKTGKQLRNGDQLYAQYIAKQFLQGQPKDVAAKKQIAADASQPMQVIAASSIPPPAAASHDCCDAATNSVLADTTGSLVESVQLIRNFDKEYKYINRLLPVYKVQFDRADGIRVYVETTQDRFAFVMDNKRATFDLFFGIFHTWDWMNAAGSFKYVLMVLLTALGFLTTCMGLYIFFITKTKRGTSSVAKSRRTHRIVSLTACLFTLMFTFSGGLHAWEKLFPETQIADNTSYSIASGDMQPDISKMKQALKQAEIYNFSIAQIDQEFYWRVITGTAQKQSPVYLHHASYTPLENGEIKHALFLAAQMSGHSQRDVLKIEPITKFAGEYGFVNKRLPVWKVSYAQNDNERYYVETSTERCAARFSDSDLMEGYSFALLHKHHFMDWAGKSARDISTMIAAGLQILMVLIGLILFYRWMRR
ncbi:hypothetical protein HHL16_01750 [Pseudoflavitalea sp. G-6-1-2]|uniref:PepSY domain-containing protein n=1 Tax=Pseudoflavitalea sp. G-6-1-2 TaxID=2728841 RepID=UPI00146D6BF2|nr:PepSY domain-containing protein [Pseudoflavitalea sp. G-6-1-2]NML19573.1 hypothetical protein [Pseudoflavitalea sp. G-6-1-2]